MGSPAGRGGGGLHPTPVEKSERREQQEREQAVIDAQLKHEADVRSILYAKWLCTDCNNVAMVERDPLIAASTSLRACTAAR